LFSTKNSVYLRLKIRGVEVDFDRVTFQHVTMRSHPLFMLPTLEAVLIDPSFFFKDDNTPGDGSEVQVVMARSGDNAAEWVPFRIFRARPSDPTASIRTISFSAYFDAPKYLFDQTSQTFRGTASDVVRQVCGLCNLTADVDPTADDQTWRCGQKTLSEFLTRDVAPGAWADQQSAFSLAFSHVSKRMRFKNLATLVRQQPRFTASDDPNVPSDYQIAEKEANSASGLMNILAGGYGLATTGFDVVTGGHTRVSGVEVARAGGRLAMNAQLAGSRAKQVYAPLAFGNVHANLERARGQNVRVLGTFNQSVDILLKQYSEVDVYDPVGVTIKTIAGRGRVDEVQSSKYIAIGRAQIVTPAEYAERISLVRNSYDNENGDLL
jgi:hypothetical protein